MRVAVIAGELSGDRLGAALLAALRTRCGDTLQIDGIAGPLMQAAGAKSLWPLSALSVMGIVEVLSHLPSLLRLRRAVIAHYLATPPDVCITIDAPDFTLPVATTLRQHGIATVHCVSPSVWAWRRGRVRTVARAADCLLTLLPFEADCYQGSGLDVRYVGHPAATECVTMPREQARRELMLPQQTQVIALLPGSRHSECRRHLPLLVDCLSRLPVATKVVVPCALPTLRPLLQAAFVGDARVLIVDDLRAALSAADAAVAASGTVTLECALYGCPMVVFYRMQPLTYALIRRRLHTPGGFVSLPNLIAGECIVPELLQQQASGAALAQTLAEVLRNADRQRQAFAALRAVLQRDFGTLGADAVLAVANK